MMYWQGFSKRGPQASHLYRWEMWQSQINVSLPAPCPLIQHLVKLLALPLHVPSKPASNISVSPSFCALAILHCSSSRTGLYAVSLSAAMTHRTSGWSGVITQSPLPEKIHDQGQHSFFNSRQTGERFRLGRGWAKQKFFPVPALQSLSFFWASRHWWG